MREEKIDLQLQELQTQKQNLIDTLNSNGASCTSEETLNTLIPKINNLDLATNYFNCQPESMTVKDWILKNYLLKTPILILPTSVTSTSYLCENAGAVLPKIICGNHVTNMSYMYSETNVIGPVDVSGLDTSNVTNMSYMFNEITALGNQNIPELICTNFNTSKVTTMKQMFRSCPARKIDISSFDFSNVTDMSGMFQNGYYISEIVFGTFNTAKLQILSQAFSNANKLTTIPAIDCSSVTEIYYTFDGCALLENFGGCINLGKAFTNKTSNYAAYNLELDQNPNLTHESLIKVLNGLYDLNLTYDVANGGTLYTQRITLGSTNKAKLTAEEIAIATNKGWTVS